MKTLTRTIVIKMEVVAVPIEGSEDLVLVHTKTGKEHSMVIMKKDKFEKAKFPEQIKNYEFVMPHFEKRKKGDVYQSTYCVFSKEQYEAIKLGEHDWYDKKYNPSKLKFGEPVPEDCIALGYCGADYSFVYLDGSYVNRVIRDFYLGKNYRIEDLIKEEKENPNVMILPRNSWSDDPIYYVPGNGSTVNLGFRLTDEQYAEYKTKDLYTRTLYLEKVTALGKYKRDEELRDDEVECGYRY